MNTVDIVHSNIPRDRSKHITMGDILLCNRCKSEKTRGWTKYLKY